MPSEKYLVMLKEYAHWSTVLRQVAEAVSEVTEDFILYPDPEDPRRRLVLEIFNFVSPAKVWRALLKVFHVSKAYYVLRDGLPKDLNVVALVAPYALMEFIGRFRPGSFKVVAKKLNVRMSETSIDICRVVGRAVEELCRLPVNVRDPDIVLYVQFGRYGALVGVLPREYMRRQRVISRDFFRELTVIVEQPLLDYEIMDIVRVCASCGVKLVFVRPDKSAFRKAFSVKPTMFKAVDIEVVDNLRDALKSVDVKVALTPHAEDNEDKLIEIFVDALRKGRRVGVLVGNEVRGLSIEALDIADYRVRLGPRTGLSMRSSGAISYVLGIFTAVKLRLSRLIY